MGTVSRNIVTGAAVLLASGAAVVFVRPQPLARDAVTTTVSTRAVAIAPSARQTATFLFFGDIMLDRNVGQRIVERGLPSLLQPLREVGFLSADLISANLEGPVTNGGAHYPPEAGIDFAFSPTVVGGFREYGFNFFNLANNHVLDQGQRGWRETGQNLARLGFNFSGCPDAQVGECTATSTRVGGFTIGLAGFSMVYSRFSTATAEAAIRELASTTDLVVANVHWGSEYQHVANDIQRAVAHQLIEAGADIIIGHHPHVIQGLERYRGKLIFYSLGNFIFDQYFSADTQQGLALGVTIAGTTAEQISYDVALFPLQSSSSAVGLMGEVDRARTLALISSWSPQLSEDDRNAIITGSLRGN